MELENVQSRSSKIRESSNIRDFKGESRIVGDAPKSSSEHGSYQVGTGGEDCNESNPVVPQGWTVSGIPGKIIGQLTDEVEKQLAYHEQQAEVLRDQLRELKQIPESLTDINHTE
jgi:hypothetical protein